jgi:hypothetical protein
MSFAIALKNDAETVANIEATIDILKGLSHPSNNINSEDFSTSETILELLDWFEDIYKILTDYTMFAQEEENVNP